MSAIRRRTIEGLKPGERFAVTRRFGEADTLRFGELTRDYNPVHHDERFARAKGLPGRICHGLLVGALCAFVAWGRSTKAPIPPR